MLAGPRLSLRPATTSDHCTVPTRTSSASPTRTSFEGFTRAPFSCTWPPTTASVARLRVLKKRAAHSHLSIRTCSITAAISLPHAAPPRPVAVHARGGYGGSTAALPADRADRAQSLSRTGRRGPRPRLARRLHRHAALGPRRRPPDRRGACARDRLRRGRGCIRSARVRAWLRRTHARGRRA